jgi:sulfate adenylyltransferase subunit 2
LYFAKERPVVFRGEQMIMVDDDRFPLINGEVPVMKKIRFRTLAAIHLLRLSNLMPLRSQKLLKK